LETAKTISAETPTLGRSRSHAYPQGKPPARADTRETPAGKAGKRRKVYQPLPGDAETADGRAADRARAAFKKPVFSGKVNRRVKALIFSKLILKIKRPFISN
jgi:hypothetical protein